MSTEFHRFSSPRLSIRPSCLKRHISSSLSNRATSSMLLAAAPQPNGVAMGLHTQRAYGRMPCVHDHGGSTGTWREKCTANKGWAKFGRFAGDNFY